MTMRAGPTLGSVYVFTEPAGGWATATGDVKLTASDGAADDGFGWSVAVDGATVVVGAPFDDKGGSGSGSVYVFFEPAAGWAAGSENFRLVDAGAAADDEFGYSVAVDGDRFVTGAPNDDDGGSDSGSAFVYQAVDWTPIGDSAAGGANAVSYAVTGLSNGTKYSFRVRAENGVGFSDASATVSVTLAVPGQPTGLAATAGVLRCCWAGTLRLTAASPLSSIGTPWRRRWRCGWRRTQPKATGWGTRWPSTATRS